MPADGDKILEEIAAATSLREGPEGVRSILQAAARGGNTPLKELARAVRMPLPVVSAVRRELEKGGIFARDKGVCLTEVGEEIAAQLGIVPDESFACAECSGAGFVIPDSMQDTLASLRAAQARMPEVDVQLDQAFALPETSLRRAIYALEHGAIAGRNVVFIGDDDLTCLAVALVLKIRGSSPVGNLALVEIDERIIALIEALCDEHQVNIECHVHDVRDPLPEELRARFHTFFTDPPYTLSGMRVFLARAAEALEAGSGRQGFLSFGHRDPDVDIEVFRAISELGFAPVEVIPGFNSYSGGGILGNISRMIRLASGTGVTGRIPERFDEPIYTGEINVSYRIYICIGCGEQHRVGRAYDNATIEALKNAGCRECGENKFKLAEKIKSSQ